MNDLNLGRLRASGMNWQFHDGLLAKVHLDSGGQRVCCLQPGKTFDRTVVYGVMTHEMASL